MVTDAARAPMVSGRYRKVLPRSPERSSNPASAPSVQTLIIAILFHEFFQSGAASCCFLYLQFQSERRQESDNFGDAKLSKAAVFQRI